MKTNWTRYVPAAVLAALVVGGFVVLDWRQRAEAQGRRGGTVVQGPAQPFVRPPFGPRYTVIETQGFNLLVADNAENKLYYYATDKDVPVGAPLKLRASLDLTKVGQKEISITPHNLENMRKKERAEPAEPK